MNFRVNSPRILIRVVPIALCLVSLTLAQQLADEQYKIQWHEHTFYTIRPMPPMARALTLEVYPDIVEGYHFVQFTGPVTKQMKAQVDSAGGVLLNYVPNNTYIVKMNAATRELVGSLSTVQWVGIYQPAMRISRRLINRIEGKEIEPPRVPYPLKFEKPDTVAETVESPPLQLTILVFRGEDMRRISQSVVSAGGTILATSKGKRRSKLRVTIPVENIYELARINGIIWIEEFILPKIFNDAARGVMNVTPVWNDHGLRGNDQIVGVGDTGLDSGVDNASMHDDIEGRVVRIFSQPVDAGSGANNVGADDGASDLDGGHGTHVAGSVLGDGTVSGGTYSGVAPDASLVFQATEQFTDWPAFPGWPTDGYYLTGLPVNLNDLFQDAYDAGARIHTNSWGSDANGNYTDQAEEVDEFVWEHPDMLVLFAAGNYGADADQNNVVDPGSVASPGTAKNALTVGASENNRPTIPQTYFFTYGPVIDADQIADNTSGLAAFSGRGPTIDGRIKPDLAAPGTMVASTRSQASPNTVWFIDDMESGTSGWTAGGNWAQITADAHSPNTSWHDSPGAGVNYGNNTDASLTSPVQNISGGGLGGKALHWWTRYALGSGDEWFLDVSSNGGVTWPASVGPFTGTQANWELWTIGLGAYSSEANFRVRFRLQSDNDGVTGDGLYIDDVRIVEGAFGSSLLSDQGLTPAGSVDDQNYLLMNGTSMATPLTAGAAAIVRQYYTDVVGLGYVSAALLRATLINGASELSPGQYGTGANQEMGNKPNNVEGWGRVDLENSLFPAPPAVLDHVDELAGLATGENHTYSLEITNTTVPLAITMVYHDYPGAGLYNNLDMTVTTPDPGSTTMFPNGLTTTDNINNVEQILIPAPRLGTYTITVDGQNVNTSTEPDDPRPQPYAIVTSGGGAIVPRNPVYVMLVLDLSGSMLSKACPTCEPKLDVLKDAVELFAQLWTAVAVPEDRIGITYFKTNISEHSVGGDVLIPVLPNVPGIIADVQGQTTVGTNLTAMGGGLQSAINRLRLVDDTRPRNIILFTDGMQNVNPMVSLPPGPYDIVDVGGRTDSNIDPDDPPTRLDMDLGIEVNTIGVGATDPFVDLLDNIATETGGLSKLTTAPDDDLRRFYLEELIAALRDYSPQLLAYNYGTLTTTTATETFTANNGASKIILKLSWNRKDNLTFRVEKDGSDLTGFGQIIEGSFYRIFYLDFPAEVNGNPIGAGGDWHMHIDGKPGTAYEAAAIVEEPLLEYDFSIGRKDYVAGDPLELNVRLDLGGQPVTDARRVTAEVLRPQQGLGTLLSVTPTPTEPPGFQLESAATAGQRKFQLLLRDERFYHDMQPVGQLLTLNNNGDGSYSTSFSNTKSTGTYTVIFQVEGERADIGRYERTETLSTMVRFGRAVRGASDLRLSLLDETADGQSMLLHIRPKDRYKNFLGPDYDHRIKASLSTGFVGDDKHDLVNGGYTIPLFVPPAADPELTVTVMDQPVYEGPLSLIDQYVTSIHIGITLPVGEFDNVYDPGVLVELDVEYRHSRQLSLEAVVGRYAFKPSYGILGGTLYLKGYQPLNGFRLYGALGPGLYKPENVNTTFGVSIGIGVNRALSQRVQADLGAYYFHLFPEGDAIDFVVVKAGMRYSF